jgi:hypothetical protein
MAGRRAADWRFPTPKQAKAEETARRMREAAAQRLAVDDEAAWWAAVLADPRADSRRPAPARTIGEMRGKLLRVECLRCFRVAQIEREEALRLVGSLWKDVATHLLADGCQHRTGRHEEDGCWPDFR